MFDEIIVPEHNLSDITYGIIVITIAILSAIVAARIRNSKWLRDFLNKWFRITPNNYLWNDIIDMHKSGNIVRVYLKEEKRIYSGTLFTYNVENDELCNFALTNYEIYDEYGELVSSVNNADDYQSYIIFNSKNVESIEIINKKYSEDSH